jgi:putative flippase GtrA
MPEFLKRFTQLAAGTAARPLRYAFVGVINTLVGYGCILLAMQFLPFGLVGSNILGYMAGYFIGYNLNRIWTFQNSVPSSFAKTKYLAVLLTAYLANLLTVLVVDHFFHWPPVISQAAGIIPFAIVGYVGSSQIVFLHKK